MQISTAILAATLALTSSTTASPLAPRQNTTLQDWQVFGVAVGTPSGRPGSYPWASITANVTDPNEYNLGPAKSDGSAVIVPGGSQGINCKAQWYTKGESPLDRTWPCAPTNYGYWVMNVLAGSSAGFGSSNFGLRFTHVVDLLYQGSEYTASYEAEGHFEVGDNLAGVCGGSGVCSWGLKEGSNPVEVVPTKL